MLALYWGWEVSVPGHREYGKLRNKQGKEGQQIQCGVLLTKTATALVGNS